MKQSSEYLAGIEWSGWPVDDAHGKHEDPCRRAAGYVYIAQSSDGWIKVGRANNAKNRVRGHAKQADLRGARLTRVFVSPPHSGWWETEKSLIAFCSERASEAHGKEYFRGLDFAEVVGHVQAIPMSLPTMDELERRSGQARDFFKQMGHSLGVGDEVQASEDDGCHEEFDYLITPAGQLAIVAEFMRRGLIRFGSNGPELVSK